MTKAFAGLGFFLFKSKGVFYTQGNDILIFLTLL